MNMDKKVYRSRISVLYIIVFGFFWGGSMYWLGSFFNLGTYILIGAFIFMFIAFRSLHYVLTDKEIQVYYLWGLQGKRYYPYIIPISGITSAERTYRVVWGGSLKQIRLNFKESHKRRHISIAGILPSISPAREQEFLETLKTLNPDIQINVTEKKGWWWRFLGWDLIN